MERSKGEAVSVSGGPQLKRAAALLLTGITAPRIIII